MTSWTAKLPHWAQDLKAAAVDWAEDDAGMMAAAISYYSALSFFPLILILISMLGYALEYSPAAQNAQAALLSTVADSFSPAAADAIQTVLSGVEANAGLGTRIGLFTLLLTAIGIFIQFDSAFMRIWNRPPRPKKGIFGFVRHLLIERFKAFLMLVGLGAAIGLIFLAGLAMSIAQSYLDDRIRAPLLWSWLDIGLTLGLNSLAFGALYKLLPPPPIRWSDALKGGFLAAILWGVGREILTGVAFDAKYTAYGIVGTFIALMLWIFVGACVIFYGAEYVQRLTARRRQAAVVKGTRPRLVHSR